MASGSGIRQAFRGLLGAPAVTTAAVLCLAVGIGATTAIFTAVNAALLRALPFPDPDRLVTVFRTTPHFQSGPFAPANFLDLRRQTRTLEGLGAVGTGAGLMELTDGSERVSTAAVSGEVMPLLGLAALRGRLIGPEDEAESAPAVAVLSEPFWRDRFGADPDIVGRSVRVDGEERTVVGVAPAALRVPWRGSVVDADVWIPLRFGPQQATARRNNYLMLLGRLAPGADRTAAEDELRTVMAGIIEENPVLEGEQLRLVGLHESSVAGVKEPLVLLLGAVGLVLLIAAGNVASLLLARGVGRRGEWAVRTALGAGRGTLMRSALLESAVLAAVGALAGLAVAWVGVEVIESFVPPGLPQLADLTPDARVLGFAVGLAVLVALLAGLVPAWQAGRTDPQAALRSEVRGAGERRHRRLLAALVVAEVALSLVLLLGAGLVMRGFENLVGRDPGFDPEGLLTLVVDVAPERYRDVGAPTSFLPQALERVRALPGVEAAGAVNLIPYESWGWNFNIRYEGQPGDDPTRLPLVERRVAAPGLFDALDMTLLQGRLLTDADGASDDDPAVVVANRALAERDFPGEDAVGKRYHTGDTTFATIVGVVADIRNFGPDREPRPEVYVPYAQAWSGTTSFPLLVRVAGDPAARSAEVVAALREVDPTVAVSRVRPMAEVIAESMGRPRFYLVLMGVFAGVALVLALGGLYGVTSYAVARRRREIGIRTALGSDPAATVRLVVRDGMVLVALGIAAGLAGAWALGGAVERLLYGTSPLDPLAWGGVTVLMVLTAAAALLAPARRAASVAPLEAIRTE